MMEQATWIVDDEVSYLRWLDDGGGFIANTTHSRINPDYFVLHRATCRTIQPGKSYEQGAFTERGYSKVVARSMEAMQTFMRDHGVPGFSKRCSRCSP